MPQRIQKLIAASGLCSRREAERLIAGGRVTLNGRIAEIGQSAEPAVDELLVDGKPLPEAKQHVYIMLNKPAGVVTTMSDEKGRRSVADIVKIEGRRLYPVGRLDMFSEGLLLMTDDGALTNILTHPSHGVSKIYRTVVSGANANRADELVPAIREIDGLPVTAAQVRVLGSEGGKTTIDITIFEGRNRQVRRLCALAGMKVHSLTRIAEGELRLDGLPTGCWRSLTDGELSYLRRLADAEKR